jgi:hypothetical protein
MTTHRSSDASSIASTGASTDAQATALEWNGLRGLPSRRVTTEYCSRGGISQ